MQLFESTGWAEEGPDMERFRSIKANTTWQS